MSHALTFQPNPALKMAKEKAKSEFKTAKLAITAQKKHHDKSGATSADKPQCSRK